MSFDVMCLSVFVENYPAFCLPLILNIGAVPLTSWISSTVKGELSQAKFPNVGPCLSRLESGSGQPMQGPFQPTTTTRLTLGHLTKTSKCTNRSWCCLSGTALRGSPCRSHTCWRESGSMPGSSGWRMGSAGWTPCWTSQMLPHIRIAACPKIERHKMEQSNCIMSKCSGPLLQSG